ncbi:hypothetical protein LOTGIDRAFT_230080 [Lottia gigantea]|uniref:Matrin-type domain-containing protein n=1 Tax=Lottia gigantea TaxID=225164 RepID=V4CRC2_LOTGI|nr:hypothetical protein LOTGIDRAFT_230080 [Lottia gigantea]ESP05045.1 hypothetical protein LOTGIDRAFT_230080 [Lottia gigantea]
MDRDRFMYERGRDMGMDREFEMRGRGGGGGGLLPGPVDDFEMGRERGPYGPSGILGEVPRGRPLLSEPSAPPSLMGRNGPTPSTVDPLTVGLQEQLMNHKRLEEKLNLRESQLALASNLLQQQSQMIGDINTKMGAPGLMGPAPGPLGPPGGPSPGRIPSLLDGPPGPRPGPPPMMPMKRPNEGMRMDMKRSRFDQGPPPTVHQGRPDFIRPGGIRREEYDPKFPTTDRGFGQHMRSRQHEERMRGVGDVARSNMARNQAQQHLRLLEDDDSFCKLCVEPLKIPADKHKKTSIHRKRVVQVNMGCRWCNVPCFKNFKEVLNHRGTKRHMDNEKKNKDLGSKRSDSSERDHRDRDRRRHDDDRGHGKDKDKKSSTSSSLSSSKKDSKDSKDSKEYKDSKSNGTSKSSTSSKPTEKKVAPKPEVKDEKVLKAQLDASEKDMKEMETATFDSKKPVGQSLVIPVTGFFCKLCHKFYNNEEAAKVGHCKTQVHFDKFKTAMLAKLKKKVEADKKALDEAVKEKTEKEAKEKSKTVVKEESKTEIIEIKDDDETAEKEEVESVDEGKAEEDSTEQTTAQNQDETMDPDDTMKTVDFADVTAEEKSLLADGDENGTAKMEDENQNGDADHTEDDIADNSDAAIIGLEESNEDQTTDDAQNENEAENETENPENETDETITEEATETSEPTEGATTKSPRSRVRTGKPRGGKAKRGKK